MVTSLTMVLWSGVHCIWQDIETTGLRRDDPHVVAIAAKVVPLERKSRRYPVLARDLTDKHLFSCFVRPPVQMSPAATRVNGLTDAFLQASGLSLTMALCLLHLWILDVKLVYGEHLPIWLIAHNGNEFDVPIFVQNEFMDNTGVYTPLFTAVRIFLNIN
eukprot:GHVU01075031.1.p1 GENE.GHVU01075031.1~~GHVU01075031.1.p1  ORF type:complete len:160 (-),score=3.47 GHVU01075031.1:606-1085(-)